MSVSQDTSKTTSLGRFSDLFASRNSRVYLNNGTETDLVSLVTSTNTATLIGWLRHYGCTLCKKQASDWKTLRAQLESRECGPVDMVLVGNGRPEQAAAFAEEVGWTEGIVSDPSRETYAVLGFRKGMGSTFNLSALKKTIKSFGEGNKQSWSRVPTDAFQQGGAVLVDNDGQVRLVHKDAFAGDHAEIDALTEKVCEICA